MAVAKAALSLARMKAVATRVVMLARPIRVLRLPIKVMLRAPRRVARRSSVLALSVKRVPAHGATAVSAVPTQGVVQVVRVVATTVTPARVGSRASPASSRAPGALAAEC